MHVGKPPNWSQDTANGTGGRYGYRQNASYLLVTFTGFSSFIRVLARGPHLDSC